jgi:predicted metal-dependent peptidase|tara:strand:+ start:35 stop:1126 length:1092 start_codon:yes stop_codon:yes gene_type:complete
MSNDTFTKARSKLVLDNPFFGTLCLRLAPKATEDVDTGATDGVSLLYNPKWFEKLTSLQRLGFLAHEVMHVVLMHHLRRQERHAQKWNVAADYAINNHLVANNFILPDGGLVDDEYIDMTTEDIYNKLPEPPEGDWNIVLQKSGCGDVLDHPNMVDSSAVEAEWTVAINQAYEAAKQQGKAPASMESIIEEINAPKLDWRAILHRFLSANRKNDFSWLRPNRRFIGAGMYLPSMYSPALEEIAVAVDTSGSISDEELTTFTTETSVILRDLDPERIHFIQCDAEVQGHDEYTRESLPLKVKYKGRGGTAFEPVTNYINENIPNCKALVYLTDLEGSFGNEPAYPVLWITTQEGDAPYGEVIKI